MKFECVHTDIRYHKIGTVSMELEEDIGLQGILDRFTQFLRGCGYVIDYDKTLVIEDAV